MFFFSILPIFLFLFYTSSSRGVFCWWDVNKIPPTGCRCGGCIITEQIHIITTMHWWWHYWQQSYFIFSYFIIVIHHCWFVVVGVDLFFDNPHIYYNFPHLTNCQHCISYIKTKRKKEVLFFILSLDTFRRCFLSPLLTHVFSFFFFCYMTTLCSWEVMLAQNTCTELHMTYFHRNTMKEVHILYITCHLIKNVTFRGYKPPHKIQQKNPS